MSAQVETLEEQALALSAADRAVLAHRLLASVDCGETVSEPDAEAAWHDEIMTRIAAMDEGREPTISGAEVFASLRAITGG